MTPKQMADRIAEVDQITRASVRRTAASCERPTIDRRDCTCADCARRSAL